MLSSRHRTQGRCWSSHTLLSAVLICLAPVIHKLSLQIFWELMESNLSLYRFVPWRMYRTLSEATSLLNLIKALSDKLINTFSNDLFVVAHVCARARVEILWPVMKTLSSVEIVCLLLLALHIWIVIAWGR